MHTGGYHSIQEWMQAGARVHGYLDKEQQHARLAAMGLPGLQRIMISGGCARKASDDVASFLSSFAPLVLISVPLNDRLPKHHKVPAADIAAYDEFLDIVEESIRTHRASWDDYAIILTDMVQGIPESFVGIGASSGDGEVFLELHIEPFLWDIRKLASGASDACHLLQLWYRDGELFTASGQSSIGMCIDMRHFHRIAQGIAHARGYFEFIHGVKNGRRGTYFMEYQSSESYLSCLEMLKDTVPLARERLNAVLRQ